MTTTKLPDAVIRRDSACSRQRGSSPLSAGAGFRSFAHSGRLDATLHCDATQLAACPGQRSGKASTAPRLRPARKNDFNANFAFSGSVTPHSLSSVAGFKLRIAIPSLAGANTRSSSARLNRTAAHSAPRIKAAPQNALSLSTPGELFFDLSRGAPPRHQWRHPSRNGRTAGPAASDA